MRMPFNLIQPPKPEVRRKLQLPSSWKVREAKFRHFFYFFSVDQSLARTPKENDALTNVRVLTVL